MSREIKFRLWNSCGEKSRMFYKVGEVMECLKQQIEFNSGEGLGYSHEADGSVFMQFAGLTDKNGTDIYEGDELIYIGTNISSMTVVFYEGCFMGEGPFNILPLTDYMNANDFQSIEIIGNIYENPELLNPPVK